MTKGKAGGEVEAIEGKKWRRIEIEDKKVSTQTFQYKNGPNGPFLVIAVCYFAGTGVGTRRDQDAAMRVGNGVNIKSRNPLVLITATEAAGERRKALLGFYYRLAQLAGQAVGPQGLGLGDVLQPGQYLGQPGLSQHAGGAAQPVRQLAQLQMIFFCQRLLDGGLLGGQFLGKVG